MQKSSGTSCSGRLLRLPEVILKVGIKKDSIYKRMAKNEFPKPVSLGGRAVAWVGSEIDQYISDKVSDRDHELRKSRKIKGLTHE